MKCDLELNVFNYNISYRTRWRRDDDNLHVYCINWIKNSADLCILKCKSILCTCFIKHIFNCLLTTLTCLIPSTLQYSVDVIKFSSQFGLYVSYVHVSCCIFRRSPSRSLPVSRRYPSTPVVTPHTFNRDATGAIYTYYVPVA